MDSWWKSNRWWFGTYACVLLLCVVVLIVYEKYDIGLIINGVNSDFLDGFFKIFTLFGTFSLIAPIVLLTLFFRYRIALTATASSLFAVVLTQLGKRVIWPDSPRPKVLYSGLDTYHLVEGVKLHGAHSFPSGHTSGAFALFIVLILYSKSPLQKQLFLLAAILVAYSRMYLSQHFLIDVTVGSLIGLISAFLAYGWLNAPALGKRKGLDGHLRPTPPWIG